MKKFMLLIIVAIAYACNSPKSEQVPDTLAPQAFSDGLKSDSEIIILDVRTPQEVSEGIIDGAENIDFNSENFSASLDSLDHAKTYFVYCAGGKRSAKAVNLMKEKGFQRVTGLEGGMNSWKASGLPVKKP